MCFVKDSHKRRESPCFEGFLNPDLCPEVLMFFLQYFTHILLSDNYSMKLNKQY